MNSTTLADGIVLKTRDGLDEIRFERRLAHPIEKVGVRLRAHMPWLEATR